MKKFTYGNQSLCFLTLDNIGELVIENMKYIILVNSKSEECIHRKEEFECLLDTNCMEVYCIGKYSEILHDFFDEIIESEKNLISILTTHDIDISVKDACFYFVKAAGVNNIQDLLVFSCGDRALEKELESLLRKNNHQKKPARMGGPRGVTFRGRKY
jgi:hypothetical protein